jgi:hypothetical protein
MAAILAQSKKLGVGYKGTILVQEDKGQSVCTLGVANKVSPKIKVV